MRACGSLILALVTAVAAAAAEPPERLSLEALFGEEALEIEQLGALHWLPDGEHMIYWLSGKGDNVLWREHAASGERARLADWKAVMDGLAEQRPHAATSGVGDVNSASGARGRPVLSPDGALLAGVTSGDLYVFELASGRARFLTGDREPEIFPAFSPDGTKLGFVKGGDLHWVELATGVAHRVTDRGGNVHELNGVADWVTEEELGAERCYWWSPDGSRLAFLQFDQRPVGVVPITDDAMPYPGLEEQWYPKAGTANARVRLGVVPAIGGEPVWVDTGAGDHYLPRAGWTPGGEVWAQRLSRGQDRLELLLAAPDGGPVRTLLTESDPAWVDVHDDLHFLNDGRFLWSSERDGWRHLFLHGADGALIRRLTAGDWEVQALIGVDAAQRTAFFEANRGDLRQRHLFSVSLEGGAMARLDRGERGTHEGRPSPAGDMIVDTWSSVDEPPRADVLFLGGAPPRRMWESGQELAGWDLLPVEQGSLAAADGTELHSLLIRPRGPEPGRRHPVVLYVYGGPHSQLTADRWGGSIHDTFRLLADMGIGVFMVDNRGTAGRGRDFETAIHRRLGELEVADQVAAARWLGAQDWVDPERIAVYGGSYGGYMTLMLLLKAPELFRAGVAYAPVTDWRLYDSIYAERYMDTPEQNPEGYESSAPLTWAENLRGALLLAHGSMDNNVHLQNTLQLVGSLAEADRRFELMVYPRTRHGVRRSSFALHFHRLKTEFLARHLLGPSTE
ncbi:MAG: alpha/beta fold hydrolase [Thermoanaerobaculales bacterium]|jgi:dipeptidyl-peptidase-4|nr:alpha/beta fold hydrolase [Thermoanaerobaculales bacterium]